MYVAPDVYEQPSKSPHLSGSHPCLTEQPVVGVATEWQFGVSDFLEAFPESCFFRDWNPPSSWKNLWEGVCWPLGYGSWYGCPHKTLFPQTMLAQGHGETPPRAGGPDLVNTLSCFAVPELGPQPLTPHKEGDTS
ncbi:hypothetical protein HJG60_007819 [Phyllostomus discolor]|uniref:Uncharacterized protein n=1 Tax=Phyllostomus discolor TaxID=89673 RepID=A0A834BN91_9CHIR|nr:hypothetical protein HJG60_007819 [Phyllostomus discolor]